MQIPETRYTKSGEVNIAYSVSGDGPLDLVLVLGWVTQLEYLWEHPSSARMLTRLGSFSRLILFDKRGVGLSDRGGPPGTLEERMDDVRAVMDAVGSQRAALVGVSEGAPMCVLFAATYPERTAALVLIGGYARIVRGEDHPWGFTEDELHAFKERVVSGWGGVVSLGTWASSYKDDPQFRRWWATYTKLGASPGAVRELMELYPQIDVRHVLPAIRVPTLIVHRTDDRAVRAAGAQYMAAHITGSKYVELPGDDHLPWSGDSETLLGEVEEFLTGQRHHREPDRALATVLFTDIVGSTERASAMGDSAWRDLLSEHNAAIRREVERFRGRAIKTTGDGFLASFDGPARAVRCACAIRDAMRPFNIEIRAGLHTGECEVIGDDLSGLAVHIGARVASLADPGEVLCSSTVKDLVAGSGLAFKDRGVHVLKGVPGDWRLFAVT